MLLRAAAGDCMDVVPGWLVGWLFIQSCEHHHRVSRGLTTGRCIKTHIIGYKLCLGQNVWNVVQLLMFCFSSPQYKSSDLLCVPLCQWCIICRLPPTLSQAANLQPSLTFELITGDPSLLNWCSPLFWPWRSEVKKYSVPKRRRGDRNGTDLV